MSQECVLIFRLGSIGDTVVALPCFHAIARRYPDARRVLLTNALVSTRTSSAESILGGTGLIAKVIYYPVGDFSTGQALALRREIRALRPTTLIYLADRPTAAPVYRDLLFFKACGIPRIVGLPWTRRMRECRTEPGSGVLEFECSRLARSLGDAMPVTLSRPGWDLTLSSAETSRARAAMSGIARQTPLMALAPGAKIAAKDWGAASWAALLDAIAPRWPNAGLLMVGARDERALCDQLATHWPGAVVNTCGELSPRESAAAFRDCRVLICHDSGPMHLAASQDTPCVALFGNFNLPRRWYPYGSRHRVVHEPRGVREIGVQRVVQAIQQVLETGPDGQAEPVVA